MPNLSSCLDGDKALSDLSPKDKSWDKHKGYVSALAALYSQLGDLRYSQRLLDCSRWLEFALVASDADEIKLKLFAARFCRFRHCPICQWRRSLMWIARLSQALPKLLAEYSNVHFLLLTLTCRNCSVDELRATIGKMNKAWERLTKRKAFPALGFLKSVEVTRSQDGSAHPHFHVLLIVGPSYFTGRAYLSQAKWTELWAKSLRIDYQPVIDIRKIRVRPESENPLTGLMDAVRETCKYSVKPVDLVRDKEWLAKITAELHKTRAVSVGGILRDYLSEDEPEDLITELDEDSSEDVIQTLVFGWREMVSKYLLIS